MNQPPDDQTPVEIGLPGVESISVSEDGRKVVAFNPIQSKVQWPGVSVTSFNFDKSEPHDKFYDQALAFLNAAKVLCEVAGKRGAAGEDLTWSQGSVCYYCVHIATELFLKACLLTHSVQFDKNHKLPDLLSLYHEALPQPEFRLQLLLAWLQPSSSFESMLDRAPDQLYRYRLGKDGQASAYTHQFSPDTVFNGIAHLECVWPRAWHALHE